MSARREALGALAWTLVAMGPGCSSGKDRTAALHFQDVAALAGLTRISRAGSPEKLWIFENVGTGCALLDADGDGRLDVFLPNAGTLKGLTLLPGPGPALYVQVPGGRFTDRTREAGLESAAWQTGVAAGDVDNDGDADLFVSCRGKSLFYRNRGGVFVEGAEAAGITGEPFSTSSVFFDYDRDGFLDLYVASYADFHRDRPPNGGHPCLLNGIPVACGPGHSETTPGRLYHNESGERFTDVSAATQIALKEGSYGLGVAAGDFDADGWPDLYVANDTTANFLFRNTGGKQFQEVALWAGVALSDSGQGQAGMGTDLADADGDGHIDCIVTNYSEEYNAYYRNLGNGTFEDATHAAGLAAESFLPLGWGVKFADFDNDGDLDLIAANGHVHPRIAAANPAISYRQRCLFYENAGAGRFSERGRELGAAFAAPRGHRGLAVGDIDDDGDLDVLLSVLDEPPVLLRNDGSGLGSWISLRLEGTKSNRDGIGARVTLTAGGHAQLREVTRGGSYLSAQDPRLHFGIGPAERADSVRVVWPGGTEEEVGPLAGRGHYVIVEGSGRASRLDR